MIYFFTSSFRSIILATCLFSIAGTSLCFSALKDDNADPIQPFFQSVTSRFDNVVTPEFEKTFRERVSRVQIFLEEKSLDSILSVQRKYLENFYFPSSSSPAGIQKDLLRNFSLFVDMETIFYDQKSGIVTDFAYKALEKLFPGSGLKDSFAFLKSNKISFGHVQFDGDEEKTLQKIKDQIPSLKIGEELQEMFLDTTSSWNKAQAYAKGEGQLFDHFIDGQGNLSKSVKKARAVTPERKEIKPFTPTRSPLRSKNAEIQTEEQGYKVILVPNLLGGQENKSRAL